MIIGLTGGIGSGKSYCAKIFEKLGVPIYYSDARAKQLMKSDEDLKSQIIQLFGDESYRSDQSLNRKHLSNLIFNNKELLKQMNQIVHPAVRKDFLEWGEIQLNKHKYVLQESALIFETGSHKIMNKVILVDAPVEIRLARVMARDKVDKSSVQNRMSKQLPSAEKRKKADYLIDNDGSQLVTPILNIHFELLR